MAWSISILCQVIGFIGKKGRGGLDRTRDTAGVVVVGHVCPDSGTSVLLRPLGWLIASSVGFCSVCVCVRVNEIISCEGDRWSLALDIEVCVCRIVD